MKRKRLKGFTLLELIIVLVIISILIAIAVPAIGKFQESARVKAEQMEMLSIKEAATLYLIDKNWDGNELSIDKLISDKYLEKSKSENFSSKYKISFDKTTKLVTVEKSNSTAN